MPGEVTGHTEKPLHYTYLKEFRTQQCPDFLLHKCTHHRPYTCFSWHFVNQKRRRPIRKKDGSFNYSPDIYCPKYAETTGICPNGDECTLLHRVAGDIERRYHLRYFKTCPCVYETDSRGLCSKNGAHCAFAHGIDDLRQPVYDSHDIQMMAEGDSEDSPHNLLMSSLEKDILYNEDPVWNDPNYVLLNYKTEACHRPHRLCRQGYACPSYHNPRDKRRSPKSHKYRSTPCPNVKYGDEWGDPPQCENGDSCTYCHTRTEQQFHPEIYKSTKCNDMVQTGYCPRGQFCAFAHIEKELNGQWEVLFSGDTSLSDFVENALPSTESKPASSTEESSATVGNFADMLDVANGCRKTSLPSEQLVSCNPRLNEGSISKVLPEPIGKRRTVSLSEGSALRQYKISQERQMLMKQQQKKNLIDSKLTIDTNDIFSCHTSATGHPLLEGFATNSPRISSNFSTLGSTPSTPLSNMSPHATSFYPAEDTVESVIAGALDEELDFGLGGLNFSSYDKDDNDSVCSSLSASFPSFDFSSTFMYPGSYFGSSIPMAIPSTSNYQLNKGLIGSIGQQLMSSSNPYGSFSPMTSMETLHSQQLKQDQKQSPQACSSSYFGDFSCRSYPGYSSNMQSLTTSSSVPKSGFCVGGTSTSEMQRLKDDLMVCQMKLTKWEEGIQQARTACDAWSKEVEESNRRIRRLEDECRLIIRQRDEAVTQANILRQEQDALKRLPLVRSLQGIGGDLDRLPVPILRQIHAQLCHDKEIVEKKLRAAPCVLCQSSSTNSIVPPCSHCTLCNTCASTTNDCPVCGTKIQTTG